MVQCLHTLNWKLCDNIHFSVSSLFALSHTTHQPVVHKQSFVQMFRHNTSERK